MAKGINIDSLKNRFNQSNNRDELVEIREDKVNNSGKQMMHQHKGGNIDSLKNRFNQSNNSEELVDLQEDIYCSYIKQGKAVEARKYLDSLMFTSKIEEYRLKALLYRLKGTLMLENKENIDSAIYFYNKGLNNIKNNDATVEAGRLFYELSLCYFYKDEKDSANIYLEKAKRIYENTQYNKGLCLYYYECLRRACLENNNIKKRYEYCEKLLYYLEKYDGFLIKFYALIFKADLNFEIGNNLSAIKDLNKALALAEKENYTTGVLSICADFVEYYRRNYDFFSEMIDVNKYLKKGDDTINRDSASKIDLNIVNFFYVNYALVAIKRKDIAKTEQLLNKIKHTLGLTNNEIIRHQFEILKSELLLLKNKPQKALALLQQIDTDILHNQVAEDYYKAKQKALKLLGKYKALSVVLEQINKLEKEKNEVHTKNLIIGNTIKYESEKKAIENKKLKAEKEYQQLLLLKENRKKWVLLIGLLLVVLVLITVLYYNNRNRKQKQVIEQLQRELHHRIKNNLAIINRFVEVLKEEFVSPQFCEKLTELQNRIYSINQVHQQLYKSSNITTLNMEKYIKTLANNVTLSFPNSNITIVDDIDKNLALSSSKSFPLGIIINEFITNSFKYAFSNNKGTMNIALHREESRCNLTLSDNGKGLPPNFNMEEDANFGLRIIGLLCEQIDASMRWENSNGLQLHIAFKA